MRKLIVAALFVSATMSGCGSKSNDKKDGNQNIDGFGLVGGETQTGNQGISGAGEILFNNSLGSVDSGKRFEIAVNLDIEAELGVVTYANKDLQGGIELTIEREESGELHVHLLSDGHTANISPDFEGIDSSKTLTFALEVHNDEVPAHVLVEDLATEKVIFNSAEEHTHEHGDLQALVEDHEHDHDHDEGSETVEGNGKGNFWGLRLSKGTTVSQAKATTPEEGH